MDSEISQREEQRVSRLNQARKAAALANDVFGASHGNPRTVMSLGKRFGKHWPILIVAVIFDLFALVPFFSVVVNFCFGFVMHLYFGKKRIMAGTVLPIAIGSVLDFFASLLPVNLAAAAIRIALKETVE